MIQSNLHTTPEQRFFFPRNMFPANDPIEYHDSFSLDGLPRLQSMSGEEHYAVIADEDDELVARNVSGERYALTPGAIVISIRALSEAQAKTPHRPNSIHQEDFELLDPDHKFAPTSDMVMMVQAVANTYKPIPHPDFSDEKVAFLPATQPLPSFKREGIKDNDIRFRLLGFITAGDVLATWSGPRSHNANLVDWAVINQNVQNRLEEALLNHDIDGQLSIVGLLSIQPTAKGYLEYFDAKHGTTYTPTSDFNLTPRFPNMTPEQKEEYFRLIRITL